jgi:hypothetical protein
MTWSDVAVAAAFVIGVALGGTGVIRVYKYTVEYLRGERDGGDDAGQQ